MKLPVIFLLTAAFLSGCQRLSYQAPTGDNTATVHFTSDNIGVQPFICVDGDFKATGHSVSPSSFDGELRSQLNAAMKKKSVVDTTIVADGAVVHLGFQMQQRKRPSGIRKTCKVAVQFTPAAGEIYKAHFVYDKRCDISLTHADDQPVKDAVVTPWQCPNL